MQSTIERRHHRREARADNTVKRWTDREVLALLRAATAPAYVLDRVAAMMKVEGASVLLVPPKGRKP